MNTRNLMILASVLFVLFAGDVALGQGCGPGCPACSGKTEGELISQKTVLGSVLYIPDGEEETTVLRFSFGIFSWMDVGIGYGLDGEETIWSARAQVVEQDEDGWRPTLFLGTGSVQTGGSDQSAYIQIGKSRELVEGRLGVGLTGGYATDLPDLEENWGLVTASVKLFDKVSPLYTYDGVSSHVGCAVFATEWLALTGYYLEMEEPAVSVSIQWSFDKAEAE